MDVDDLEIADFEDKCPTCKNVVIPRILDRLPQMLHIPPRYALLCPKCKTPWYKRREEP